MRRTLRYASEVGSGADDGARQRAVEVIDAVVTRLGLEVTRTEPAIFSVRLPGAAKLATDCALEVGHHTVSVRAFVARNPDENHDGVYRWLLERNLKLYGVAFSVDALGDIYLTGRVSLASVTEAEIDRLLGSVAQAADASFNTIVELGFAESIKREWVWRRSRGESTANLAAFAHLDPGR
jgi:Putative bacterial sensory transduction regulator